MSVQTSSSSKRAAVLQKYDDDVVVVTAVRSAITKVRHLHIHFIQNSY